MKYYGKIGFAGEVEYKPGRWRDEVIEKQYFGDVLRNSYRNQISDKLVTDYQVSNQISILADQFALQNIPKIIYITWMNTKWRVTSVDVNYPRMNLTLGTEYKEEIESEDG